MSAGPGSSTTPTASRPATTPSRSTPRARGWPSPTSRCRRTIRPTRATTRSHAYFEPYVDHFGFRHTITFDTTVEDVSRSADGRWDVRVTGADAPRPAPTTPCSSPTATTGTRLARAGLSGRPSPASRSTPTTTAPVTSSPARRRRGRRRQLGDGHRGRVVPTWRVRRRGRCAAPSGCCASSSSASRATRSLLPGWLPWWVTAARLRIGATPPASMTKYGLPAPTHKPGSRTPCSPRGSASASTPGAVTADAHRAARRRPRRLRRRHHRPGGPHRVGHRLPRQLPVLRARPGVGRRQRPAAVEATVHPDLPGLYFIGLRPGHRCGDADRRGPVCVDRRDARRSPTCRPPTTSYAARWRVEHERDNKQFYASPRHTMEVDFDHYLWDLAARAQEGTRPVLRRRQRRAALRASAAGGRSTCPAAGVLVGAPHTSNWDWVLTMLLAGPTASTSSCWSRRSSSWARSAGCCAARAPSSSTARTRRRPSRSCWPRPRAATPGSSGSRPRAPDRAVTTGSRLLPDRPADRPADHAGLPRRALAHRRLGSDVPPDGRRQRRHGRLARLLRRQDRLQPRQVHATAPARGGPGLRLAHRGVTSTSLCNLREG